MNVVLDIPEDLQAHIKDQIQAGIYSSAVEYFLDLGQQDRQRQSNRERIAQLLQESLNYGSHLYISRNNDRVPIAWICYFAR